MSEHEARDEALLHDRLVRFCSIVAEVSARETGEHETYHLEVLLARGMLVGINEKGHGYNIQ